MKQYKAIIVDDEKPVLRLMEHVIGMNGRYSIEGTYANPLEALEAARSIAPDVAFLDIEMPRLGGLELARQLGELWPDTRIVFSTAYRNYALDAFEVSAIDYILKPVTPAAIARVTSRLDRLTPSEPAARQAGRKAAIRCFGTFEARTSEGEVVRWRTRKTEELFAYLLCHPGRDIGKWKLVDALWPELDEERAMNNMYNAVYRLKKTLKEHGFGMDVHKTQEGYLLDTGGMDYDIVSFLRYGAGTDTSDAVAAEDRPLEEAVCSAYQGRLLDSKDYDWKIPLESAYARQYEIAVRSLLQKHAEAGEWEQAERRLVAFLEHEPLNEEMNGMLLDMYERAGYADKARKHYAAFASAYRAEYGEEPKAVGASIRLDGQS